MDTSLNLFDQLQRSLIGQQKWLVAHIMRGSFWLVQIIFFIEYLWQNFGSQDAVNYKPNRILILNQTCW